MYCIDTSALIYMKNIYDIRVLPSLWKTFGNIAKESNLIISPSQVLRELEKRDDELLKWAKEHIPFHNLDHTQQEIVRDIMSRFQTLVDINSSTQEADPFVIALAKSKNCKVVTQESYINRSGPKSKFNIPNVCEELSVRWIRLLELFTELKVEI